jgi:hypothetical protein
VKLSDAILLGSTVLTSRAGAQYYKDQDAGCALGMAAIAGGCTFGPARSAVAEHNRRTFGTERVWGQWVLQVVERPCNCWRFWTPREMRIKDIIAHIFDRHIMRKKNWTLERLVAWIKTVEPAEDPALKLEKSSLASASPRSEFATRTLRADISLLEEEREWKRVRETFAAKYKSEQTRRTPGTSSR